ncbi:MAG: hypothetical protein MUO91_06835 [candidate division Zixibacteria bacterium]|nr:hypothetical protein [candidate division Zixibacteria bacterium]
MKKKIILISFCLILFLIFTALSYAKPDPRYIFQGDPWDHALVMGQDTTSRYTNNVILLSINHNMILILNIRSISSVEPKQKTINSSPSFGIFEKKCQGSQKSIQQK